MTGKDFANANPGAAFRRVPCPNPTAKVESLMINLRASRREAALARESERQQASFSPISRL
jgi:hypothetical protein